MPSRTCARRSGTIPLNGTTAVFVPLTKLPKKQDSQSPLIIRNRYHTYGKEYVINVTSKFEIA